MIFVTGGTGIVGSRLLFDLISKNKSVRALHRPGSDLKLVREIFSYYSPQDGNELFSKIDWHQGDLEDIHSLEEGMNNVTQVYHAAALVSYDSRDKNRLLEVNARGTANLVNICVEARIQDFCHISSVAALGVEENGNSVSEATDWKRENNRSNYGLSKYMAEREVWRGMAEGLNGVIVNPSVILGPGKENQSSAALFALLAKGTRFYPQGRIGVVDVRDVSEAAILLMEKGIRGERFILNGENLSYRDFLNSAAEAFKKPKPRLKLSAWILEIAWISTWFWSKISGTRQLISKETARAVRRKMNYNSSKIERTTGIKLRKAKESLRDFADYYS